LVEDELGLRAVVNESRQQEGYKVLLAANSVDALQEAERYNSHIQLLITDVIMPFMIGPESAQSLKRRGQRLAYSSCPDTLPIRSPIMPNWTLTWRFCKKPFKLGDLAQKVHGLMNDGAGKAHS